MTQAKSPSPPPFTFEQAFSRLEEIAEKMNSGALPLDESLKLYEEANKLITYCSKQLVEAERKMEILVKSRSGELAMDGDQPLMKDFTPPGK